MSRIKKTEGGQGGKRGHSNMTHHTKTADIKELSNLHRRLQGKIIIKYNIDNMNQDDKQSPSLDQRIKY